jgi:mono/diheme cytochrome c family protein
MGVKLFLLFGLLSLVACSENHFKEDKFFAGGVYASAAQLNLGKTVYTEYCMACHGVNGDGKGVASKGLIPPPRNFTLGIYKFGKVVAGELPHDDHLVEIIQKGLNGTGMLKWDISKDQSLAVVQYIKTFAPKVWEGKDKKLGEPIIVSKDPYGMARRSSAIERGKVVYHGVAQCYTCHQAYVPFEELSKIQKEVNGDALAENDPENYKLKLQDSDHGYKNIPPDFTWHPLRSINSTEDIYIRLAAGVGGTSMPSWKDTLSDDDIWAAAYYVEYLQSLKDTIDREKIVNNAK